MPSVESAVSRSVFRMFVGVMALTSMVSASRLMAQDQSGTLVGKVSDSSSAPVSSAMLHVLDSRAGTVSGDDGRYRIAGIAPGQNSVVARRQGFVTDTIVVTIGTAQRRAQRGAACDSRGAEAGRGHWVAATQRDATGRARQAAQGRQHRIRDVG
jgi:hypothetical protein